MPSATWVELTQPSLVRNPANDGDSFLIQHTGGQHLLRLYGVDCPEKKSHALNRTRLADQGAAFGGALGLICASDIAIATERASFCLSEVKLGLIPAVISPYVARAMGNRASRRYMLTAERFDAQTALKLNVIHEINDDLATAAQPIITAMLANSPQGMAWVKTLLARLEDGVIDQDTIDYTSERIARIRVSDEGQEGLNAFFEKRQPNWHTPTDTQGVL